MNSDRQARIRALDPTTSFIVQAPAGSGKTELLIQRYLRLLATVDSPQSAVAITFTKKAAGEMRNRVIEALLRAQAGRMPDREHEHLTYEIAKRVLDRDARLGWGLLGNPAQMRMETIDALCAAITRQMPWLARFGAPPEITEKAQPLYKEAARNTLRKLEREERDRVPGPVSRLLLHLDNDFARAEILIGQMLEKRDQWLRHVGTGSDIARMRPELEASFQKLISAHLKALHSCFSEDIAAELVAIRGASFPEPCLEDLEEWNSLASFLLTKDGDIRRRPTSDVARHQRRRCEEMLEAIGQDHRLVEALQYFRRLPAPVFSDSQWQAMLDVVSILPEAVAELQLVFGNRGMVDFTELSLRAMDALGPPDNPTDLALALGYRIEHLLVDEFQDTSFTHFQLICRLTAGWEPGDGRTLFLVGDPMQSIYRFRQADVSLFLRAEEEGIGHIRLEPLYLSTNFRAAPELVEWVNRTLAPLFPSDDNMDTGAVAFRPSQSGGSDTGAVQCHAFLDVKAEGELAIELAKKPNTAILVRSRSHLSEIVPMLRSAGIPFQAVEIEELGRRPIIQDLMALTFALLHRADRISWLALLRAPWCGLTLADLHSLAGGDWTTPIWDLLHSPLEHISEDGRIRIRRVVNVLERALSQRARHSLRDWIEETWTLLGGPACAALNDLKDAAAYFELLESLDTGSDLEDFADLHTQVSELFAAPQVQAPGMLQVMTIHKAKGLEFETVILPGLGQKSRSDDSSLLVWQEQKGELLLAPISGSEGNDRIYDYLNWVEKEKARQEVCRLLYVAVTRARKNLHLLGCVKRCDDGSFKASGGSFLGLLWPMVNSRFIPASDVQEQQSIPVVRQIRRVPQAWQTPAPLSDVHWITHDLATAEPEKISYEWVGDTLRHIGTALHTYMQRIARDGLENWNEHRVRSYRPAFQTLLAALGVGPSDLQEAADSVERGLIQVLQSERGRWILASHPNAESEYPLTGWIDGQVYRGVIDRTFIDAKGVRWIIDYKTSVHLGSNVEAFLNNEKLRYQAQLERYARLMQQLEDRPIRLALFFPLLGGWREWQAPPARRKQASFAFDG